MFVREPCDGQIVPFGVHLELILIQFKHWAVPLIESPTALDCQIRSNVAKHSSITNVRNDRIRVLDCSSSGPIIDVVLGNYNTTHEYCSSLGLTVYEDLLAIALVHAIHP